jgi:hypothetical protein
MLKQGVRLISMACWVACLTASPALAGGTNNAGFGVEGFYNQYKESDLSVKDTSDSGSLTAYYSHQSGRVFVALDGRASYGTDDFTSPTGGVSGIPQWEFELRSRIGYSFPVWGGEMSPYIGVGWRYDIAQGKNYTTNLVPPGYPPGFGYEDYDRSTSQFYVPIGASYSYAFDGGWSITPQAEADFMFYGSADSRLTNILYGAPVASQCSPSCNFIQFLSPANNDQHFGIGGRGELMVGKNLGGYSLQAGPFVRYWYVNQSDKVTYQISNGTTASYSVPKNTDMQAGVSLRVLF